MKSYSKLFLVAGLFLFPLMVRAQISNVQVAAEGEQIIITYDYAAQAESIDDIVVTYTTGESTEAKEAVQVTGDVHGITPGTGKRIVWSPLSESTSFSAENLVINLTGVRDKMKQEQCDNSLKLAEQFFADKDYENAITYYNEMLECVSCNCHPKDIEYATGQLRLAQRDLKISSFKDKFHISYLFDMATAEGGSSMHGLSAFLLRNKGVGVYASFRSDKSFYNQTGRTSYYQDDESLQGVGPGDNNGDGVIDGDEQGSGAHYEMLPTANRRVSSWLFSTGLTAKLINTEYASAFFYGGLGIGSNSIGQEYRVTERGYASDEWLTDGVRNLFLSPEAGVMANIYDYASVMAGIKYPLSLTSHEAMKLKGLSVMLGVGVKLKSIEKGGYKPANTYIAYILDIPGKAGPDKLQSANIIGFSVGTLSYHRVGAYFSARINPLLFKSFEEADLGGNPTYTGVNDYGNAFGTLGLTWMCFYGGVGVAYQKEYKSYTQDGAEFWNSPGGKFGLCTEFGVNLRLFDRLLLRGGATFPSFKLNSENNVLSMGAHKAYLSLGIGYVLSSAN